MTQPLIDHESPNVTAIRPASPSSFNIVGNPSPLFEALARAQGEFPDIGKTEDVDVTKDNRKLYSFVYAPLDAVLRAVRPALAKHGLCLFHGVCGPRDRLSLRTFLAHAGGSYIECVSELKPKDARIQDVGSEITYLRRYTVLAMLGIFPSDEDDDGGAAEGLTVQRNQKPPQRPQANHAPAAVRSVAPAEAPKKSYTDKVVDALPKPADILQELRGATIPEPVDSPEAALAADEDGVVLSEDEKARRRVSGIREATGLIKKLGITTKEAAKSLMKELVGKEASAELTYDDTMRFVAALQERIAAQP